MTASCASTSDAARRCVSRRPRLRASLLALAAALPLALAAADAPSSLPDVPWQLPPRAVTPTGVDRDHFLAPLERGARAMRGLQDARGAIVDPYVKREFQYATPYFAHAVGQLLASGRGVDLRDAGVRAMDHATRSVAGGAAAIPDRHGEFYLPALSEALALYEGRVEDARWREWQARLRTPLWDVLDGYGEHTNNWRTYAMRGEWLRSVHALAQRDATVAFIEQSWHDFQRERMTRSRWNLYLDHSSDPNSQAVEAVGRGNLAALLAAGYHGPSAGEMQALVDRATRTSLLLQDPTGQAPPNGRTDDHVWNDILYQLCFEIAAERAAAAGQDRLAGQYRRAASLAFRSALRWQRDDGAFSVTKNFFDNAWRVGYQPASQWTNYNGAVLIHLAEAFAVRQTPIEEQPTPAEIGGYAFENDPQFGSAFVNAGGLQLMINLRGEVDPAKYNVYWTPIGVARVSRAGWESRLGPLDGVRDTFSGRGVTLGPTWREGTRWVRLADVPDRYRGRFEVALATPALTIATVHYAPVAGRQGPSFALTFTVTPDLVLARLTHDATVPVGWTLPVLADDGRGPLRTAAGDGIVSAAYDEAGDAQTYLVPGPAAIDASEDAVLGPAGWLRPVRAESNDVVIYPRRAGEPTAAQVRAGMRLDDDGITTPLVRVRGQVAIGRDYAGGRARAVDLDGDGADDLRFTDDTSFTARLEGGRVSWIETDRAVSGHVHGRSLRLAAHVPTRVVAP